MSLLTDGTHDRYGRSNRWLALMKEVTDVLLDVRAEEDEWEQVDRAADELSEHVKQMPKPYADLANSIIELAADITD